MKSQLGNIEIGTLSDIDELEKLYNELNDYLESKTNYAGWRKGVYPIRGTAETGVVEGNLFNLRVDDKIAGSIILNHKQVEWETEADNSQIIVIHTLVVHPKFIKQGISQKLMSFAKDYAIQKL